jgi:hypothetical protein
MPKADQILSEAAKTFAERNKVYGDNYLNVGRAFVALFPEGLTLKTVKDFNRFHLFMLSVVKLTRYCNNWDNGGHQDSIHDSTVYNAMVESVDGMEFPEAISEQFQPKWAIPDDVIKQLADLRRAAPTEQMTSEMILGKFRDMARQIEENVEEGVPF